MALFTRALNRNFANAAGWRNLPARVSDRLRPCDCPAVRLPVPRKPFVSSCLRLIYRFCQTNLVPISNTSWPDSPSPARAHFHFCQTNLIPKSDTNPAASASRGYTKGTYPHG